MFRIETETIMAKKAAQQLLRFKGFVSPRYTQVPDALFDELMAYLSGAELKVLLYIRHYSNREPIIGVKSEAYYENRFL